VLKHPAAMRRRLLAAGAQPGFTGLMLDRRYDRDGTLLAKDEVLRLRGFREPDGSERFHLGWKGPTAVTPEGYKARHELEYEIRGTVPPEALLEALGFRESYRIDRYVEYYRLGDTAVRLEWYPRMDSLIEIEGDAAGIEAALRATGLPRSEFHADALPAFAARYAARTGRPALLALDPASREPPSWELR
jgi:adenylate cyclase class IV